ncbi:IS630 family transposase, partial [archaeon]|nr:IS630 family transposase [archaeon]
IESISFTSSSRRSHPAIPIRSIWLPRIVLEAYRYRAIELYQKEKSAQEIAFFFGLHRGSVSLWIKTWKEKGKSALKSRKALGPESKLNKEDKKQIISWLKKSAMEFGFETPLWDCKRIQRMIKQNLNKEIAISNLWENLRRWKLTPQKPDKVALERNQRKVNKWIREEWPKIEEHRRRWQAMLYFQDESSVSLVPVLGTTWAKKGETPKVKVTGNRGSIAVSSVISPAGRMLFRIEKDTVNSETFVDFLKQIMRNHRWRKIIVVTDNSKPHTSAYVQNFVEQSKNKIAVYYLPKYSPDLNPDEEVWKYLKNVKLEAHQARNKKEFRPLIRAKMQSIQKKPNLIKSFFVGTYVI